MPEQKSILRLIMLHLVAILFVIMNVSNVKIAGLSNLIPLFDLMAVFYFGAFKAIFGIWFIFLLGLWNDSLSGNPLGATSLCYILLVKLFSLLNSRMMIRENFQQVWRQFVAFCLLFLTMKFVIISIFNGAFLSIITPMVQFILSSLIYVVMHKFFDYLSQRLLGEE